jgi:hypothetical protein
VPVGRYRAKSKETAMSDHIDRYPADREEKDKRKKAEQREHLDEKLEEGLEESFPASDPPAATQPKKPTPAGPKKS